jgi:hypothetical protein
VTPKELEARCRAVGVWPEGLTIHAPSGDWYRYAGFVNADEAEAFILAELMAKMPTGYGVLHNVGGGCFWSCLGSSSGVAAINCGDTTLEAALACHEHAKGIK